MLWVYVSRVWPVYEYAFNLWQKRGDTGYLDANLSYDAPGEHWRELLAALATSFTGAGIVLCTRESKRSQSRSPSTSNGQTVTRTMSLLECRLRSANACFRRTSSPITPSASTVTVSPSRSQSLVGTTLAFPAVLGAFFLLIELSLDSGVLGAGRSFTVFEEIIGIAALIISLPALPTLAELADVGPQPFGLIVGAAPGALLWGWLGAFVFNSARLRCSD